MQITKFSPKQGKIFRFMAQPQKALICDGAVRSGKTAAMTLAFVIWAMGNFDKTNFAICGKTVQSAERNILIPFQTVEGLPYRTEYKTSKMVLTVRCGSKENYFYLFGGKDERSYSLIQGITLAGVLFDEVALMPQSFVDQAVARTLTYEGKKLWFNCNPDSPNHWFYQEWVLHPEKHNAIHLHFEMRDNPIMTPEAIQDAESMFSGVFYDRYILGRWVAAEGRVYPDFDPDTCYIKPEDVPVGDICKWFVGVDFGWEHYGAMVLLGRTEDGRCYLVREWAAQHRHIDDWATIGQRIKEELGNINFYCDTARPDLIQQLRVAGLRAINARKDVLAGISEVASLYKRHKLFIVRDSAPRFQDEIYSYAWKPGADEPIKENDDVQDAIRYAIYSDRKYGR